MDYLVAKLALGTCSCGLPVILMWASNDSERRGLYMVLHDTETLSDWFIHPVYAVQHYEMQICP